MPPPIPLSGAGAWYTGGSQSGSLRSSANRGLIASHAPAGELAAAIAASTAATKARTTGVSRTNSALTGEICNQVAPAMSCSQVGGLRVAFGVVRLYVAGPLFSEAERAWLDGLAARLRSEGFDCFVPHEAFAELADATLEEVYRVDAE